MRFKRKQKDPHDRRRQLLELRQEFLKLKEQGEISATRSPDGHWTLYGPPDICARFRELAERAAFLAGYDGQAPKT